MVKAAYLLDSNILSEPIRLQPNRGVMTRLRRYKDHLATASVVWHELLYGCYRLPDSVKRRRLETYLKEIIAPTMLVLPYNEKAAEWHAFERARMTREGNTPPFADGQIASIAQVNGLILVTNNASDFQRFEGLQFESWHS